MERPNSISLHAAARRERALYIGRLLRAAADLLFKAKDREPVHAARSLVIIQITPSAGRTLEQKRALTGRSPSGWRGSRCAARTCS